MTELNLPSYNYRLNETGDSIFDPVRKKFVVLTPEEWVRQHFMNYLIHDRKCPATLIKAEFEIKYNKLIKRPDIVVFDRKGEPALIIECKAPSVALQQSTFEQVAVYNKVLNSPYIAVSNGIVHYCAKLTPNSGQYKFLSEIPEYTTLIK